MEDIRQQQKTKAEQDVMACCCVCDAVMADGRWYCFAQNGAQHAWMMRLSCNSGVRRSEICLPDVRGWARLGSRYVTFVYSALHCTVLVVLQHVGMSWAGVLRLRLQRAC
jgi:hypothetical protein